MEFSSIKFSGQSNRSASTTVSVCFREQERVLSQGGEGEQVLHAHTKKTPLGLGSGHIRSCLSHQRMKKARYDKGQSNSTI